MKRKEGYCFTIQTAEADPGEAVEVIRPELGSLGHAWWESFEVIPGDPPKLVFLWSYDRTTYEGDDT